MNSMQKNRLFVLLLSGITLISNLLYSQHQFQQKPVAIGLASPALISPANGTELHNFPRTFTMKWSAISGATYELEIDCKNCSIPGQWDSVAGTSIKKTGLIQTSYQHTFPGDNQGRWRVRSKKGGLNSKWTEWWYFSFITSSTPAGPPNICIDGLLKIGNKTTPWGQNYTITLTPQDACSSSAGNYAFNIQYGIKNCQGGPSGKFMNQILFNDKVVSQQTNLQLGTAGSTLPIRTQAYLPIQNGILKIKLDSANNIVEDWENDNAVWVNVKFIGF